MSRTSDGLWRSKTRRLILVAPSAFGTRKDSVKDSDAVSSSFSASSFEALAQLDASRFRSSPELTRRVSSSFLSPQTSTPPSAGLRTIPTISLIPAVPSTPTSQLLRRPPPLLSPTGTTLRIRGSNLRTRRCDDEGGARILPGVLRVKEERAGRGTRTV